jgi:hypothetical protein
MCAAVFAWSFTSSCWIVNAGQQGEGARSDLRGRKHILLSTDFQVQLLLITHEAAVIEMVANPA